MVLEVHVYTDIINEFKELSSKHGLWEVFTDFLIFGTNMLSNSCDLDKYDEREKEFRVREERYSKDEMKNFSKILAMLIQELEKQPTDVLGELFMLLELKNKWKGQFFTPYSIAKLCADLTISKESIEQQIKEKGFVKVNDCCSGGGVMFIAIAERLKELGYNYQKQLLVIGADIDIKSVQMSYIQLSLLGIPGIIYHQNSLSLETYDVYKTPFYLLQGWKFRERSK